MTKIMEGIAKITRSSVGGAGAPAPPTEIAASGFYLLRTRRKE